MDDFATVLNYTMNMQEHEAYDIFHTIDKQCLGYITFGEYESLCLLDYLTVCFIF